MATMPTEADKPRFQKIFLTMGGSVLGIFALAVLLGIALVRDGVRGQILQRDGVLLSSVAQYLHDGLNTSATAHWDLVELALESSEIRGVIAVRSIPRTSRRCSPASRSSATFRGSAWNTCSPTCSRLRRPIPSRWSK